MFDLLLLFVLRNTFFLTMSELLKLLKATVFSSDFKTSSFKEIHITFNLLWSQKKTQEFSSQSGSQHVQFGLLPTWSNSSIPAAVAEAF